MSRDTRRYQEYKHKTRRLNDIKAMLSTTEHLNNPRRAGAYKHSSTLCSCTQCRNPRHSSYAKGERLTIQEKHNLTNFKEQLNDP